MTDTTPIPGGYVLYPRAFIEAFAETALLDRALWLWLLCRANHQDRYRAGAALARGQLLATSRQIAEGLRYRDGARLVVPTKDQIFRALQRLRRRDFIVTHRTTRGLIITLCDYAYYQNPTAYGRHARASETDDAEIADTQPDRQEGNNEKKEKGTSRSSGRMGLKTFEEIDRQRARQALVQAQEEFLADD